MKRYQRSLIRLIRQHCKNPRAGCEVGVYRGWTSECLGGWFKDCKVYFVDPWIEWSPDSEFYKSSRRGIGSHTQAEWDEISLEAMQRILSCRIKRFEVLRMTSKDAAKLVSDEELDFTFIDAAHDYDSVKQDIELWLPKTAKLLSGHDYGGAYVGVKKAVDEMFGEYVVVRPGRIWAVDLNKWRQSV